MATLDLKEMGKFGKIGKKLCSVGCLPVSLAIVASDRISAKCANHGGKSAP